MLGGQIYSQGTVTLLQGAQDVEAHAEGASGSPAETPLAPYVPLMATDAVTDAAAALLLDDVVPVREESVVVVESLSSNAGPRPDQCPVELAACLVL